MIQLIINAAGWTLVHSLWIGGLSAIVAALLSWAAGQSASKRYIANCIGLFATVLGCVITFLTAAAMEWSTVSAAQVSGIAAGAVSLPETGIKAWIPYLVSAWVFGVAAYAVRMMVSLGCLYNLRRRSVVATERWQAVLTDLRQRLNVPDSVELLASTRIDSPMTFGVVRKVILFPASLLSGMPEDLIVALLAHELAHVRRFDYLVNLIQSAAEALLFYHPAIWWLSKRIRFERELCCDEIAAELVGDRLLYAKALTCLEEARVHNHALAVAANGGNLMHRIRVLVGLQPTLQSPTWAPGAAIVTGVVSAALLAPTIGGAQVPDANKATVKVSDGTHSISVPAHELSSGLPDSAVISIDGKRTTVGKLTKKRRSEVRALLRTLMPASASPNLDIEVQPKTSAGFPLTELKAQSMTIPGMRIEVPEINVPEITVPGFEIPIPEVNIEPHAFEFPGMQSSPRDQRLTPKQRAELQRQMSKLRTELKSLDSLKSLKNFQNLKGLNQIELNSKIRKAIEEARKAAKLDAEGNQNFNFSFTTPEESKHDLEEAKREMEQAKREAEADMREAKLEAEREMQEARQEALRESGEARKEAIREAEEARKEALRDAEEARKEAAQAGQNWGNGNSFSFSTSPEVNIAPGFNWSGQTKVYVDGKPIKSGQKIKAGQEVVVKTYQYKNGKRVVGETKLIFGKSGATIVAPRTAPRAPKPARAPQVVAPSSPTVAPEAPEAPATSAGGRSSESAAVCNSDGE